MTVLCRDVSVSFKNKPVLSGFSASFGPGVTGLLGVNGAGKTTLMRAMAGALHVTAGTVDVQGSSEAGKVSYMPQDLAVPGSVPVIDAVTYMLWLRGVPTKQCHDQAMAALQAVGLEAEAKRRYRKLSGGMKRRVALAQAIAGQPEIVLLDEPSTGLDPEQRRTMVDLVAQIPGTVVMSSHVMEDIADLANDVVVLHQGQNAFQGALQNMVETAGTAQDSRPLEAAFFKLVGRRT